MNHELPDDLLARYLNGSASDEDRRWLKDWLVANSNHSQILRDFEAAWQTMNERLPTPSFDVDQGWANLSERLGLEEHGTPGADIVPLRPTRRWFWLQAAAVLVLAVLGAWYWSRSSQAIVWQEIANGSEGIQSFHLPDGSEVVLNRASRLRWQQGFQGELRQIELIGQGFFSVTRGEKPFVVETPSAQVQVLGTRFEVWARNEKTRVSVLEGKVGVRKGDHEVILTQNQRLMSQPNGLATVETVDTQALLAWIEGRLVFHQQTLEDVCIDLGASFGTSIQLADDELGLRRVTATFRGTSLKTILEELALALGLKVTPRGDGFLISR